MKKFLLGALITIIVLMLIFIIVMEVYPFS